ncbi:acetylornithine deacetylase [Desulfuromonas versatilis]|uniref:Acetylornithine deacetylase n=1 Tax=Desulfuromonas versatilis TaxID=2802975 RepID=A0ABM8HRI1_9BACT|nr:ArgE/DapE family deacylase [Desulfuromonas versatilis]BCR03550.1 acetylornithine deacetylase [Desulfuromonas versatilis]
MTTAEQRILATVDALADEIIDFSARLVSEPSTLGNEASALRVMEDELVRLGLPPERVPIDPAVLAEHPGFAPVPWSYQGRYNLVAARPADGQGGRSALFNGHLDVVSPAPVDFWETDPFTPVIRDGWLYGRGAGDMKGGVAAMSYALHAVERAGFGLRAPVTLEAVIEEECCGNGALACREAGYDADAVLIPEPFGPTLYTAQVGVLWFKVRMRGVSCHVQATAAGANAIEKSYPIIASLRRLEEAMNAEERPAAYRAIQHPLNLNIGIFNGGDWPSTVPAAAEFHGRLSFFPGTPYPEVCERIRAAVAEAAHSDPWLADNPPVVEFYGFRSEGHTLSRELPALATLNGCHRSLIGQDAETYISTCTTDLRAFHFFGKGVGTCYGPVAENIHGANERVNIDSILQVARAYALFLARWCHLAE